MSACFNALEPETTAKQLEHQKTQKLLGYIITQSAFTTAFRINLTRLEAAFGCVPSRIHAAHWGGGALLSGMGLTSRPCVAARGHLCVLLSYRLTHFQSECAVIKPFRHASRILCRRPASEIRLSQPSACVATLQGHGAAVSCVVFHPSLLYLATGGYDGAFRLWALDCNFIAAKCVSCHYHEVREGSCCPISSIAFHPSALCLATGSHDFSTKLWTISPGFTSAECVATLRGHSSAVTSVAFHPSANYLATCSRGRDTIMWSLTDDHTAAARVSTLNDLFKIEALEFHPTAHLLMTAGGRKLSLWALHALNDPVNTENRLLALNLGDGSITCAAFHPHAPLLAIGGDFGFSDSAKRTVVKMYRLSADFTKAECVSSIYSDWEPAVCMAFHPFSNYLATGTTYCGAQLWKLAPDGSAIRCLAVLPHDNIRCMAFHRSGRSVVTGSGDGTAKLWL